MNTKIRGNFKSLFEISKLNFKKLSNFTIRNSKDLKIISAPVITVLFIFFAFSGFLMHGSINPYYVMLSKIITLLMATTLLLYCFVDLFKSIFILPFKNILEREKEK